jgi:hypothetical protein
VVPGRCRGGAEVRSRLVRGLGLNPVLKPILEAGLAGEKPPASLFDPVSYRYYLRYVKPKIARVINGSGGGGLVVYASPSYILYSAGLNIGDGLRYYHYAIGVDSDGKAFVNRVNEPPSWYDSEFPVSGSATVRTTSDEHMRLALGYDVDLGDREEAVIGGVGRPTRYRIQGDIVLRVEPPTATINYVSYREVVAHIRLLLLDVVNRVLLDRGFSTVADREAVMLWGLAPRRRADLYARAILEELARGLGELLGDVRVNRNMNMIDVNGGDFEGYIVWVREARASPDSQSRITIIVIRGPGENRLEEEIRRRALEALNNTAPVNMEFNIGNHYVKLHSVKPLSFRLKPARQPLTLNENTITVVNPLAFITAPPSLIELYHREHGVKTVEVKDTYVISFGHVNTHPDYEAERNRIIAENLIKQEP